MRPAMYHNRAHPSPFPAVCIAIHSPPVNYIKLLPAIDAGVSIIAYQARRVKRRAKAAGVSRLPSGRRGGRQNFTKPVLEFAG